MILLRQIALAKQVQKILPWQNRILNLLKIKHIKFLPRQNAPLFTD